MEIEVRDTWPTCALSNMVDIALSDALVEVVVGGERVYGYDDALFTKCLARHGYAIVPLIQR